MNARGRFILRRLLLAVPVLLAMSAFVFLMIHLVPGDPVRTMLGFRATPENVAQVRAALGLDEPLLAQYTQWLGGILHGDLGQDFISHTPVATLLAQRLPVTIELTVLSMTLAIAVGVPLGVRAATDTRLEPTGDRGVRDRRHRDPGLLARHHARAAVRGHHEGAPTVRVRAAPRGSRAKLEVHGPARRHPRLRRGGVHLADHARSHGGDARYAVRPVRQGARALRDVDRVPAHASQRLRADRHGDRHPVRRAARRGDRHRVPVRPARRSAG